MRTRVNCLLPLILTTAMIGGLSAQGVDPGTSNLKHSWTFEDGTPNDYVGNVNGTLVGGATVSEGSLITAEQGQYMEMVGGDIMIDTYSAITLSIWYIRMKAPTRDTP